MRNGEECLCRHETMTSSSWLLMTSLLVMSQAQDNATSKVDYGVNNFGVTTNGAIDTTEWIELQDEALCDIRLHERLECSGYGTKEHDCRARGCCYDINFMMCYFPASCQKVMSLGGGGSAFLVVPGEDVPSRGSLSMLTNTPWCERETVGEMQKMELKMDLRDRRLIHISVRHVASPDYVFPFNLTYYVYRANKSEFYFDGRGPGPSNNGIAYYQKSWHEVEARYVSIMPYLAQSKSCATIELISCPAPPRANYTPPPTTPKPPPLSETMIDPDERPSAIVMGTFGLALVITLLIVFVIIDIPAYKRDFATMRRNITSFYYYYCGHRRKAAPKKENGFKWTDSKESVQLSLAEERKLEGLRFIDEDVSDHLTSV